MTKKLRNWLIIGSLLAVALPATALAAGQYFYPSNKSLQTGMLVSLSANPQIVEASSNANSKHLLGVIGPAETNAFSGIKPGQITVSTDGAAQTLVSTAGGDIKVGDRIATSRFIGAGQKATKSSWIVGTAQASFDSKTKGAAKQNDVYVGSIPVLIKVSYYVKPHEVSNSASIPTAVQKAASSIAGRPASTIAIIVSFIILVIAFGIAGFVINGSVRGSFISIGRNPLTKAVIFRGLLLTFGVAAALISAALLASVILLHVL